MKIDLAIVHEASGPHTGLIGLIGLRAIRRPKVMGVCDHLRGRAGSLLRIGTLA